MYVNCRCRWCFSDIAIWPNLRLALSICRHKMMTKWPHTMWKRTTLCCILHTLVLEVNNFHPHLQQCMKENYSLPKSAYAIQHGVVRFHVLCGHCIIILCLQSIRANHRFGQMESIFTRSDIAYIYCPVFVPKCTCMNGFIWMLQWPLDLLNANDS